MLDTLLGNAVVIDEMKVVIGGFRQKGLDLHLVREGGTFLFHDEVVDVGRDALVVLQKAVHDVEDLLGDAAPVGLEQRPAAVLGVHQEQKLVLGCQGTDNLQLLAHATLQLKLVAFLLGEVARNVEHIARTPRFRTALHDEARLEPTIARVAVLAHHRVGFLQAIGKRIQVKELAHLVDHVGRHEGGKDPLLKFVEVALTRHNLGHQPDTVDYLVLVRIKIGVEDGGVYG